MIFPKKNKRVYLLYDNKCAMIMPPNIHIATSNHLDINPSRAYLNAKCVNIIIILSFPTSINIFEIHGTFFSMLLIIYIIFSEIN